MLRFVAPQKIPVRGLTFPCLAFSGLRQSQSTQPTYFMWVKDSFKAKWTFFCLNKKKNSDGKVSLLGFISNCAIKCLKGLHLKHCLSANMQPFSTLQFKQLSRIAKCSCNKCPDFSWILYLNGCYFELDFTLKSFW